MLFHGHSYSGNPLGCAAGVASLELFDQENTFEKIAAIEKAHRLFGQAIKEHKVVKDLRIQGTVLAMEIRTEDGRGYMSSIRDKIWDYFISQGIILRPLGNVLYIMPPYCTKSEDLQGVYRTVEKFLDTLP
jgi:adenosylmethionine-8-amino-7-oxononanoate aminotransferase